MTLRRSSGQAGKAQFNPAQQRRRGMLAKIHIAQKQLGLTEDDYRAVLIRVTGLDSAGAMSDAELERVVAELTRLGFRAKADGKAKPAMHPVALKARAMWISLHQLGVVENPSEQALEAFAARQLGVVKWHWANQAWGYKLIEALKAMAQRAGWDQHLEGVAPAAKARILKRRLAERLFAMLKHEGLIPHHWDILLAAERLAGVEIGGGWWQASAEDADRVVQAFAQARRAPMKPVSALELVR
ncbi:regulatory protein GemA [Sphingomonas gilva]|uniref:Regulatory protein GemA n=1 Tax=Sphingomonas gilva TaxID=2305907 RepID=A0A396RLS9_9SPHN|nr:regulatory protein GemA [Sphingomonas gilva]RHW17179.1 regulatory protein GemA [Sphingomonas gilva]